MAFKKNRLTRRDFIRKTGKMTAGAIAGASAFSMMGVNVFADQQNDTVIYSMDQEMKSFNPILKSMSGPESFVENAIYDAMMDITPRADYVPILLTHVPTKENGGVSADGKVWKFELKKGITFHDGHACTAEDIKFSLEKYVQKDLNVSSTFGLERVASIEIKDNYHLTITLKMTTPFDYEMFRKPHIIPKHILDKVSDFKTSSFNTNPIGTGAFKFVKWAPGRYATVEKYENYHRAGKPGVKRIIFKYIPDNLMMYTQFKAGDIDMLGMSGVPRDRVSEIQNMAGVDMFLRPYPSVEFLMFNHANPMFQDKRVRQALAMAFDKDSVCNDIYNHTVKRSLSYMSPDHWAYNKNLKDPGYNPEKASQMLDAAGWRKGSDGIRQKGGIKLDFENNTSTGYNTRDQTQLLIQQQFKDIGVKMTIKNWPGNVVWGDHYTKSKFETVLSATGPDTPLDPNYMNHMHSSKIPIDTGSGANYLRFSNRKMDKLLEDGLAEKNKAKRTGIYNKYQEMFVEEVPSVPIFNWATVNAKKSGLKGYQGNIFDDSDISYTIEDWYWG
jgi:peptide/nickel transport system substrate-binding protein